MSIDHLPTFLLKLKALFFDLIIKTILKTVLKSILKTILKTMGYQLYLISQIIEKQ